MTPGQALRAIERGKIVKDRVTGTKWRRSVQDGYSVEFITDWLITFSGDNCFPAAGDFVVVKPTWPKGEVRWQKWHSGQVVWRYTAQRSGREFTPSGTKAISDPWRAGPDGPAIHNITPEEGLRLIHAMGWNEDGTKREPPKRDVGAENAALRAADEEIAALKAENERLGIALQSIADLEEDAWGKASVVVEYIGGYPREELEGVNASEIARKALEEKP